MVLNRDQELWAVALWVEKNHGEEGTAYIAQQIQRLSNEGDEAGIATWKTQLRLGMMRKWLKVWGIRIEFAVLASVSLIGPILSLQSCIG